MNERLPYEDAFEKGMNDLPLPDGEQAWQKMKVMLDEDERKRRLLPPVFFNCAGWGALLLVVLAVGWFWLQPVDWVHKKRKEDFKAKETVQKINHQEQSVPTQTTIAENKKESSGQKPSVKTKTSITSQTNDNRRIKSTGSPIKYPMNSELPEVAVQLKTKRSKPKNKTEITHQNALVKTKENTSRIRAHKNDTNSLVTITQPATIPKNDSSENLKNTVVQNVSIGDVVKKDSSQLSDTSVFKNNPSSMDKTNSKSKRQYYITLGIGEQQSINTRGQATVPYNYYGRTSSLSDYIPSIYVRLHRDEKWFLQGEFRYGAPQSVKEFSFSRLTKYDTASATLNTTTTRIKKTYYHQIPVSFNYNVLPNWSVGVGGMYSLFYGAITEKETDTKNIQTGVEINTKQIVRVPTYTDSFLYKTQWRILLQTNYQWKRFSIGVRYQRDLQPFIKYTDPAGEVHSEKNQSFDVFLRFQLWKLKKFKL